MPIRTIRDIDDSKGHDVRRHQQQQQEPIGYHHGGNGVGDDDATNGVYKSTFTLDSYPLMREIFCYRFKTNTFTFWISCLQVLMFLISLLIGSSKFDGAFAPDNSMAGPSARTFLYLGAKSTYDIKQGEIWRLVTPILLHAGILHLASNLFFQMRISFVLEEMWGTKRFALIYIISGIGASLLSANAAPNSISVGASGALFGIIGANIIFIVINWSVIPQVYRAKDLCFIIMILLINVLLSLADPLIDNWAHLGGLIVGWGFGAAYCKFLYDHPSSQKIVYGSSIGTGIYFFGMLLVLFFAVKTNK